MSTRIRNTAPHGSTARSSLARKSAWILHEVVDATPWSLSHRATLEQSESVSPAEFAVHSTRPELSGYNRNFALGMLSREAEVGASVGHPHVLSTFMATDQHDERQLIQPLLRRSPNSTNCAPAVLWTIRQIAEGLAAMHRALWLHGDICPASIVVEASGHATLIHLGLARQLHSEECDLAATPLTGQLRYSAPEMFDDSGEVTSAVDIYSLGLVLFEMLAGRSVWNYEGPELVAAKRLRAPEVRIPSSAISFSLERLLVSMLAREPLRRPAAEEVAATLAACEIATLSEWRAA